MTTQALKGKETAALLRGIFKGGCSLSCAAGGRDGTVAPAPLVGNEPVGYRLAG